MIRLLILPVLLLSLISAVNAADVFSDSFESGDWSATNDNGFKWTDKTWTSIVSSTHERLPNGTIREKDNAASFPGTDWTPKSGKYCMRFRYGAGKDWAEQRFDLGAPMSDIWVRYWIRIPTNFSFGPVGHPNKFFSLWSDGYSTKGEGSTVWLSMAKKNTADCSVWCTWSKGGKTGSTKARQNTDFFTTADRGQWMHIVMHFKTESKLGASDGVIQTWRRWEPEKEYKNIHEIIDAPIKIPKDGPNGFKAGYILGWVNAPFLENTEFLLDDFALSDSSPIPPAP